MTVATQELGSTAEQALAQEWATRAVKQIMNARRDVRHAEEAVIREKEVIVEMEKRFEAGLRAFERGELPGWQPCEESRR